jgi:hypothetical protein
MRFFGERGERKNARDSPRFRGGSETTGENGGKPRGKVRPSERSPRKDPRTTRFPSKGSFCVSILTNYRIKEKSRESAPLFPGARREGPARAPGGPRGPRPRAPPGGGTGKGFSKPLPGDPERPLDRPERFGTIRNDSAGRSGGTSRRNDTGGRSRIGRGGRSENDLRGGAFPGEKGARERDGGDSGGEVAGEVGAGSPGKREAPPRFDSRGVSAYHLNHPRLSEFGAGPGVLC